MTANIIVLLLNGLTLALALGLLIIILWQGSEKRDKPLFLPLSADGCHLVVGLAASTRSSPMWERAGAIQTGLRLLDVGFAGASISLYVYSAVLTGFQGRMFRLLARRVWSSSSATSSSCC